MPTTWCKRLFDVQFTALVRQEDSGDWVCHVDEANVKTQGSTADEAFHRAEAETTKLVTDMLENCCGNFS